MRVCHARRMVGTVGWLALLVPALSGCASCRTYTAKTLPVELEAPPVTNAQVLDLTRLTVPPNSSEQICPGDVLEVTIAAGLGREDVVTFPVQVSDNGTAVLPLIGEIPLAGFESGGAAQAIVAACRGRRLYVDPQVTVTMKRQRVNRVTVAGAVNEQGVYELPRGSSYLLAAIVMAGGFAEDAGTTVEIRRPQSPTSLASAAPGQRREGVELTAGAEPAASLARIDLAQLIRRGGVNEYLPDGSAIMIERRQPHPIEVLGLVHKPGQYELPPNQELRVLGAIALTGGISNPVANKILVVRTDPTTNEAVMIKLSYEKAKRDLRENVRLAPGDVVIVVRTPATVVIDALNIIRVSIGGSVPLVP